jgi:hypothetical protein
MKVPPWCKPAFWGVVVGAVGIMIMGFAWGGWVLGSTAERLANDRADGAVTATLQTSSRFCLPQCGLKPTVLDGRKSSDIHVRPVTRSASHEAATPHGCSLS